MQIRLISVVIKPKTTTLRVYPDREAAMRVIEGRPHMREQIEKLLRDGAEVAIRIKPKV